MTLKELREKRARIVKDMRQINDAPSGDAGDLSSEQQNQFTELRSKLEQTDSAIERQSLIDAADRQANGELLTGNGDQDFDRECRSFDLVKAIAGAANIEGVDAGREQEVSQELNRRHGGQFKGIAVPLSIFNAPMQRRDAITSAAPVGAPGGNLISTDHRGDLYYDRLRAKMITNKLGVTSLMGLGGNIDIPNLKNSATAGWVGENEALSRSSGGFDKISMAPKHVGALSEVSRNMLQQSNPDITALVTDDFAKLLAEALDKAAFVGGGGVEPLGILNAPDVSITNIVSEGDGVAESTTYRDRGLEKIERLQLANTEGTGFAMHPSVVRALRSAVVAENRFVMETADKFLDYPVAASTLIPAGQDIFGNWADLIIGTWSAIDVLVNPFEKDAYERGNVLVRSMLTADIQVRHSESFA